MYGHKNIFAMNVIQEYVIAQTEAYGGGTQALKQRGVCVWGAVKYNTVSMHDQENGE